MGGQAKKQGGVAPGSRQGGTGMMGGAVAQPATQPQMAPVQQGPDSPGMARPAVMPPNPNQGQMNQGMQARYQDMQRQRGAMTPGMGWGPPGGMPSPAQARLDALRGQGPTMLGDPNSQREVDRVAGPGSAFSTQGQQSIQQQQARAALDQYNQFNQMGQQFVDSQPFNPQLQQQFRQAQDQGYQQMKQQNPGAGIDQNTFEGFQLTNQMRAAKPQTNAGGWNDNARARERAQQFAQMTPEQFAERQRIIAGYQRER
jgi:hypothetical protein